MPDKLAIAGAIAEAIGKMIAAVAKAIGSPTDGLRTAVLDALKKQGDETDVIADEIDEHLPAGDTSER